MPPPVRISDVGLYLHCPRLVYLDNFGKIPRISNAEHILLHSLMLSISQEADLQELEEKMRGSLARLEEELGLIYEVEQEELAQACRDLEGEISKMARSLAPHLCRLVPSEAEVDLFSERLGLSGRLDRLAPGCTPSIIRTGQAPKDGIWKRDRILLAGYGLLLGDMHNSRINQGQVEYPRAGFVRSVQIHGVDKARFLRIRDRVRQIKEGQLPDRPKDAPCEQCNAREACETRHSLASRFF
jgi:CRISPR-associated exonuclease Cas4